MEQIAFTAALCIPILQVINCNKARKTLLTVEFNAVKGDN